MISIPKLLLLWTVFSFLIFVFPMLFAPDAIRKVMDKVVKNYELIRFWGLITLIFWFLYLMVHYALDWTWYMIFSILGRLCLLKALILMWFPKFIADKYRIYYGSKASTMIAWTVILFVSIFFAWVAVVKF